MRAAAGVAHDRALIDAKRIGVSAPTSAAGASASARPERGYFVAFFARLVESWRMDRPTVEAWIRARVDPVGPLETAHQEPWATVLRVPLARVPDLLWADGYGSLSATVVP